MSAARTERLLNLLALLLNTRQPLSLQAIRELDEFEAYRGADLKSGERAFERDKAALLELGIPLRYVAPESDDEADGQGGYVIDRELYYLPPLDLDPGELALLSIAGAAAAAIEGFPRRAAVIRALAKLGFDADEIVRPSVSMVHAPFSPGVDVERLGQHLELLHEAVATRTRVRLSYRNADTAKTKREVDPYGLYYRQAAWYLVGYCHLRQALRTFHLARIENLTRAGSGGNYVVPASFSLAAHARRRPWEFPHHAPLEVTIRIAARLAPAVAEIFGGDVTPEPVPQGVCVRLRVTHREALIATVLPYGAAALVLTPTDLRVEIAEIHRQLRQRYESEVPHEPT